MKLRPHPSAKARGILLVEAMVYVLVIMLVIGMAAAVYFEGLRHSRNLSGFADDIAQTLRAGERWRDDVRRSIGPIEMMENDEESAMEWRIPREDGAVIYRLANGSLTRQATEEPEIVVLSALRASRLEIDEREEIVAWRWELELESRSERARTPPLFTFQAVPGLH